MTTKKSSFFSSICGIKEFRYLQFYHCATLQRSTVWNHYWSLGFSDYCQKLLKILLIIFINLGNQLNTGQQLRLEIHQLKNACEERRAALFCARNSVGLRKEIWNTRLRKSISEVLSCVTVKRSLTCSSLWHLVGWCHLSLILYIPNIFWFPLQREENTLLFFIYKAPNWNPNLLNLKYNVTGDFLLFSVMQSIDKNLSSEESRQSLLRCHSLPKSKVTPQSKFMPNLEGLGVGGGGWCLVW